MKVRFLFYKARFEFRNFLKTRQIRLVDDAISLWTWPWNIGTGPYAHCEVWLPNFRGDFKIVIRWSSDYSGTCYTSTLRDNYKGTCKRPASEVLKHPERWDYVEIEIEEKDYERLVYWMDLEVENNQGYGKLDILKFFGLGMFADKLRNICSEHGHNAGVIAMVKRFFKPKTALPRDFYVWPIPNQVAYLSLSFNVVSPRRLARILKKAGHKIKRLK